MLFSSFAALFIASSALAAPHSGWKREVPQEHSHENILDAVRPMLNLNNPNNIVDVVFGLLDTAGAVFGSGTITDGDCVQQATADQAFTNAKAAGNIAGMTAALQYRALERNSDGPLGTPSAQCTSMTAKNPEIAAIKQHQDPAGPGAQAANKAVVLELAKQIQSIGGNPLDALKTGTFAPGVYGDSNGKGNTCDDPNDQNGCINTLNLLVDDATPAEISAAVGGVAAASSSSTSSHAGTTTAVAAAGAVATATSGANAGNSTAAQATPTSSIPADCVSVVTVTIGAAAQKNFVATQTSTSATAAATGSGGNLQKFTGALGGISAPPVTVGGRGFVVANNSDFLNLSAALGRSCDVQHNQCADKANSGGGFKVSDCDQQDNQCHALIQ